MIGKKVLVVDDEDDILDLLAYNLENEGYTVVRGRNGVEAVSLAESHRPDLIILDVMMPRMDGIQACEAIRTRADLSDTPVVFLTARNEEYAELAGFRAGGDDYIVKPVKPRILMRRLMALMRRASPAGQPKRVIELHGLEIDQDEYVVRRGNQKIELTRREFELLHYLASRPGKICTRHALLDQIWGNVHITNRTIDVHVRKLREKLGKKLIITVKGVGYKFKPEGK